VEPNLSARYKNRKLYKAFNHALNWCEKNITDSTACHEFLFNLKRTRLVLLTALTATKASEMFDGLNNTGLQLSVADIIKNKVLSAYQIPDPYTNISIEEAYELWIYFTNKIHHSYHTQFLKHLSHVLPSIIEVPDAISSSEADSKLPDSYETIISKSGKKKEKIIRKISEHSDTYSSFLTPDYSLNSSASDRALYELKSIEGSPSYSLLLYLREKKINDAVFEKTVNLLSRIFARRHIVNMPRVSTIDKNITDAIVILETEYTKNKDIPFSRISELLLGGYSKGSNLTAPKSYGTIEELTRKLNQDMYEQNADITRYLLVKLASILTTPAYVAHDPYLVFASYDKLDQPDGRRIYSIEHVMPQTENLNSYWENSLKKTIEDGYDVSEWQEKHIHKLGNLTLSADNSRLSDRDFIQKQDLTSITINNEKYNIGYKNGEILNSFVFPCRLHNDIHQKDVLTDEKTSLAQAPYWDTDLINARTKYMVDVLVENLKLPNERE
jgi:hypothetical protein